ncbi:DUF2971 domain-containing protein [Pseudomonas sp. NP21570]|nr:DUF2971 domain-containing protein [Pseudomonas sp. NP21570]
MNMYDNTAETLYRYKYVSFDSGSLQIIKEGTLKYTCPLEFNDPFDCYPAYDPKSIENIVKQRPDLIKAVAKNEGLSPAKRLMRHGRYIANIRRGVASGDFAKGLVRDLGILCLSRIPNDILMWSHYAQHHKGFVVEFEISVNAPAQDLEMILPHPVIYQERRPMLSWGDINFDIDAYFLTKSHHWSYEAEERVLTTDLGPGIHAYSRERFLRSVIAGARMAPKNIAVLKQVVEETSIKLGKKINFYQAKLAGDAYEVIIPGRFN